jgi:hypothetical protein
MNQCLACGRAFPDPATIHNAAPDAAMLCLGCGHVMMWTDTMNLRELTESERMEVGGNFELMKARAKVVPGTIQHRGSWALTTCLAVISIMVVLERLHISELPVTKRANHTIRHDTVDKPWTIHQEHRLWTDTTL